ncbi:MAG: hypothetical protein MI924_05355 [Chloroflexales bacterium]|nr:hypothetical protein [Chloroflexales bacterium]
MSLRESFLGLAVAFFFERPARNHTLEELATTLEQSGTEIETRFSIASETSANRKQMRHIVGIERWGQRRLRVALGEPPLSDEYDHYQPAADSRWEDLQTSFSKTRQETINLAHKLASNGVDGASKVAHNQFGPLSLRAWLRYLTVHANLDSKWLR